MYDMQGMREALFASRIQCVVYEISKDGTKTALAQCSMYLSYFFNDGYPLLFDQRYCRCAVVMMTAFRSSLQLMELTIPHQRYTSRFLYRTPLYLQVK